MLRVLRIQHFCYGQGSPRMQRLFVLLWIFLGVSGSLFAQESCPDPGELAQKFAQRTTALSGIKENLEKLQNGQILEINPAGLFAVDLNNQDAVDSRTKELKNVLDKTRSLRIEDSTYYSCVKKDQNLSSTLQQLLNLEVTINQLRLQFLILPDDQRKSLLAIQEQATDHKEELKEIQRQKSEAEKTAEKADQAVRAAESQIIQAESSELRKLAADKAILENSRKNIAELSLKWNKDLENLVANANQHAEKLSEDASVLAKTQTSNRKLLEAYRDVVNRWRQLTDSVLAEFTEIHEVAKIPELPRISPELVEKVKQDKAFEEYYNAWKETEADRTALLKLKERLQNEGTGAQYRLLLTAGRIRAQLIRELVKREELAVFDLNNEYFLDLFREIRLIPYRPLVYVKTELIEAGSLLSSGVAGILVLLRRIVLLLAFILIPILAFRLLRKGSDRLDQLRSWLIKSRNSFPKGPVLALWIRRLNPYMIWFTLFVATRLGAAVVDGTELEEIAEILPYFEYFFLYRIFRLLVEGLVLAFAGGSPKGNLANSNLARRVARTAKLLGTYFLVAAYILHATQSVARTGLIYHLVWKALVWVTPVLFLIAAYSWRNELGEAVTEIIPGKIGRRFKSWCSSRRLGLIAALPTAILIFVVLSTKWLLGEASQFDSAKKISAQLFRRKIESAARMRTNSSDDKSIKLSAHYESFFELDVPSDTSLMMPAQGIPIGDVVKSIQAWQNGSKEEHTIAVHGVKGIGKSTFLRALEMNLSNIDVKRTTIPRKLVDTRSLFDHLGEILNADLSGGEIDLLRLDAKIGKTLLLIDDGQNLFLARRGGFEAFRSLISLINAGTNNIFWCVNFNRYSWNYLNAVTGGSEYFSHVIPIERWNDIDIRDMILKRHQKSQYSLEFDPIIFATESAHATDGDKYIQDRFFELLWEQSRGNPRTALVLWLSSLKTIGSNKLLVGLPLSSPVRPLTRLTDDEIFVVAAIIRHENLNIEEAKSVTSLGDSTVRHAFRLGLERGFFDASQDGRYRIRPLWQAALTQQLVSKNFVYE